MIISDSIAKLFGNIRRPGRLLDVGYDGYDDCL
jgi:hypothetical protein